MMSVDEDEVEGILKLNSRILESHELKKLDKSERGILNLNAVTQKDIRIQLNDQLRCLDLRLESQQGLLAEIQDVFKRRAEIELNYSRDLDRLARLLSSRQKEQKAKAQGWGSFSSHEVWKQLLNETKKAGRDHAALAEIYNSAITSRCTQLNDDITRIYKKCREIGFEIHEEVLKVLHELHTAMKTHHTYQSEFRQAESKLQVVEKQRTKLKDQIPKEKQEKNRKFRVIEKEVTKRKHKYTEARLKATKARNEYLLCMDAANASIHKYFVDDLSDLMDCMDFGFHQSVGRAMMMRSSALEQVRRSLQQDIDSMGKVLGSLDSRLDKKFFLEKNDQAFMIPKKFEYVPVRRDESEVMQKPVLEELNSRKAKLADRLASLRAESEEIWKSLEEAEKTLLEMVNCNDYDTTRYFVEEESVRRERDIDTIVNKQRADRQDTEQFYLAKFREYILNSNRIARLQAKYDNIRKCLGDKSTAGATCTLPRPIAASRRRIGRTMLAGQPKLFGGSLEEFLESTKEDIPLIVRSCIRVINLYGLHHQGIFRVSGSQVEINNFREAFERGDDPLADMTDASDINSVCGVMKLYLRELREPIFSVQYFDQFMELAQLESKHEFVIKVRDLVKTWPRTIFVVMRYLFAFLNHLSEYSDENMMDPYNLAICFGPTLVPIPTDRDQVQYQNLVNELIKNFIIFHEDIFPTDVPGLLYEKYISLEPEDVQEFSLVADEDLESEVTEDECEVLEAQAQYDFTARSSREVTFKKGDTILLFAQVSSDWWRGSVAGKEGLIPDKYILLKIRGEEDGRETDDSRRRASSQSDTIRSSRSEHSPRIQRSHQSVTAPPATPPLSRALPHRHSISHTPGGTTTSSSSSNSVARTTVISVAPHASRESLSMDSGNPSPDTTFTSERTSRSPLSMEPGSESDSRSLELDSLSVDDYSEPRLSSESGTTVIHVSADNSMESSLSTVAEISPGPSLVHEGISRGSLDRTVRSAPPPLTRKLSPQMKTILCSQDSLTSTGSNQELRIELETSLAEVKAAVEDVVRKSSPGDIDKPIAEVDTLLELATRTPGSREGVGRQLSSDGFEPRRRKSPETGARPKSVQTPPAITPRTVKLTPSGAQDQNNVIVKQNSWGSRKSSRDQDQEPIENISLFAKNKDMWEKRSTGSPGNSSDDSGDRSASFRGNRSFWEQKSIVRNTTPGQTPDLVMDLPAGPMASSPPVPAPRPRRSKSRSPSSDSASGRSIASSEGSPGGQPGSLSSADNFAAVTDTLKKTPSSAPSPKMRPQPLTIPQPLSIPSNSPPGSTVVPIRSPGPKTPKVLAKFGAVTGTSLDSTFGSPQSSSSFKPSVKVKPVLQVKPEVKKDSGGAGAKDMKQ